MYSTSHELKKAARTRFRQRMFSMMLTAAVFIVATYLISYFSNELSGYNDWIRRIGELVSTYAGEVQAAVDDPNALQDLFARIYASMPTFQDFMVGRSLFGPLLAALVSLISLPLSAGYAHHILMESRGYNTSVGYLMHGFKVTFKTLAIGILTGLFTALGLLLFIVPGVVISLRYSLAVFILMDDPEKGPVQCMKESGRLMRGHKWRLLKLYFSFILWYIASNLVTNLIGAPLLNIYLTPYINLSTAVFYNELVHREGPGEEPIKF